MHWIATRADLSRLRAPLDILLERVDAPPATRSETIEPWFAQHLQVEPWGVLITRQREPVAGAVFARSRRLGIERLETAGYRGSAQGLPAIDSDAADLLAVALAQALGELRRPWSLYVANLPFGDPTLAALVRHLRLAVVWRTAPRARVCFVPGDPITSYLTRNTRSAVAKALNRIVRSGHRYDLKWTVDPDVIDHAIDEMIDIHRRRSLQQFGASPLEDSGMAALFGTTVRAHARAGRVRLLTLRIDGALAAFALCELTAGILWVDTNRAAPEWLAFSPGTVVNAEILRIAHGDPAIECVDWGGSVQRYKLSGQPTLMRLQCLQAWSSWAVRAAVAGERSLQLRPARGARYLERIRRVLRSRGGTAE
jgi:CelD/BcsL family acetyltransferase involved in cellulose biosynthesis